MVIREIMNSLPSVENDSIKDSMEEPRRTENDSAKKYPARVGARHSNSSEKLWITAEQQPSWQP